MSVVKMLSKAFPFHHDLRRCKIDSFINERERERKEKERERERGSEIKLRFLNEMGKSFVRKYFEAKF